MKVFPDIISPALSEKTLLTHDKKLKIPEEITILFKNGKFILTDQELLLNNICENIKNDISFVVNKLNDEIKLIIKKNKKKIQILYYYVEIVLLLIICSVFGISFYFEKILFKEYDIYYFWVILRLICFVQFGNIIYSIYKKFELINLNFKKQIYNYKKNFCKQFTQKNGLNSIILDLNKENLIIKIKINDIEKEEDLRNTNL